MTTRVAAAAVLLLALAGCGSTGQDAAPAPTPAPATSAASDPGSGGGSGGGGCADAVVVLGQPQHAGKAAGALAGVEARLNVTPGANDIVLFSVSLLDGPMPQTREQIEALRDVDLGAEAIMLVDVAAQDDPELRELVLSDLREILVKNGRDAAMPVLEEGDADLGLELDGLRARCNG